jgi:hypothetical protein
LYVFVGGKRKNVETRFQASRPQGGKNLILIRKLSIVAAVKRQHHVDDRASHEHDDGGEQDGKQKSRERNHAQPPGKP